MRTPGEYAAYFRALSDAHLQIKSFFEGDYDEILAAERSTMVYPLLWVESPEISVPEDEDGFMLHYDGAFVVLFNSTLEDTARRKTNMESAFRIAYDIVMKMLLDAQNYIFEFSIKNLRMDPVTTVNNDNDHGWRVTFTMSSQAEGCQSSEVWSDDLPTNVFARFELGDITAGVLTFVNTSNTDPSDPPVVAWQIDYFGGGEKTTTTSSDDEEVEVTLEEGFESLFIQLTLTYGDFTKIATMYIQGTPVEGSKSVPFYYNPML